jgi:hypothetical protein
MNEIIADREDCHQSESHSMMICMDESNDDLPSVGFVIDQKQFILEPTDYKQGHVLQFMSIPSKHKSDHLIILGDTFIRKQNYVEFDADINMITINGITAQLSDIEREATETTRITSAAHHNPDSIPLANSHINPSVWNKNGKWNRKDILSWQIVVIIVGGLVIFIATLFAICMCVKRKYSQPVNSSHHYRIPSDYLNPNTHTRTSSTASSSRDASERIASGILPPRYSPHPSAPAAVTIKAARPHSQYGTYAETNR